MDSGGLVVDISGAQKHLKSEDKRTSKELQTLVHKALGYGEGRMKHLVPVLYGFLKNSIHSEKTSGMDGQIYAGVAYAWKRNKINYKNPNKTKFIEKTQALIEKFINNYPRK